MAPIMQSENYLSQLKYLVSCTETLEKQGFVIRPLTNDELMLKRRCSGCNKGISSFWPFHDDLNQFSFVSITSKEPETAEICLKA